jgi:ketosteroid isomerase-like protein
VRSRRGWCRQFAPGRRDISANLDLVRSIFAGWERGEWSSTEWAHPDIEFVVADGPEPGRWVGPAEMQEAGRAILGPFEDGRVNAEEFRELDDERVLVLVHSTGRGKTSGLDIGQMQTKAADLFQLRGGKVTKLVAFWDRRNAVADLALEPEDNDP